MPNPLEVKLATARATPFEGPKRLYLPYILSWTCPECGEKNTWDMRDQYVTHPTLGSPAIEEVFCCGYNDDGEECGYIGEVKMLFKVEVTLCPE